MTLSLPPPAASLDLLGQQAAESVLLRAWASGRLGHGWLFTGRFGLGKATLAFRFARFLLVGGGSDLAIAPGHPVIGPIAAGAHPDLVHLEPKAAGRGARAIIDVDSVRAAIDRLHRTSVGTFRVLIVEQADALSHQAANALLKTLEEPAANVVLILTAEGDAQVPATIRSRVARLRLRPVADGLIVDWLSRVGAPLASAEANAPLAGGSPGLAAWLSERDALTQYATLLDRLTASHSEAGIRDVVATLQAMLASGGADLVRELVGLFVRRAVASAIGAPLPAVQPEERAALGIAGRRLDRLWEVWDKLAVLDVTAERLSLDREALLVDIAADLAGREPSPSS